ncbi:serine/threonine-protein kinase [Streptomyces sp. NPDC059708]|uniref:serine/threonine-protein kinase n=1 Tax=Streptomyces sp. NPDC059708 TaxID=3346916 RepID=UPI0036939A8B
MRFGAWVVDGELGRGGMGVVYAAVHRETGERRALKVVHAPAGAGEEVARFAREVRVSMALAHPHVVRVIGIERSGPDGAGGAPDPQGEPCCLVLELCDGGSLADRVHRDGPLPVPRALELFDGVLAGLAHVHREHGLVHRDIKPHNILLTGGPHGRPVAKLADFGLAKAYESAGLSGLTRTGVVMGTPAFMPRSQLINYKYATPEVDVWSTAASLYHVLTGSPPRDLPPGRDPWLAVATSPVVPAGERVPGLPPELCEVLDYALSDEIEGGFETAESLRAALGGN